MKLNKTLGEMLYRLFGPNGYDVQVHTSQAREMTVLRELERHGVVKLVSLNPDFPNLLTAERQVFNSLNNQKGNHPK